MLPHLACGLFALHFWVIRVAAALYEDTRFLNAIDVFDYVIVGGGTAGCVLANRLTEDASVKVLLLEAGSSNRGALDLEVPFLALTSNPQWDWNFTTVPQTGMDNIQMPYQQGFILGGSSSVNSMLYARGSAEDYDRLARLTGDPGWSWNSIFPYFIKNEIFLPPADGHNTRGQYDPVVHGTHGINGVTLPSFSFSLDALAMQAVSELHEEFPFALDYNSGRELGMGWTQSTIRNGSRSSSATSYLADNYVKRANMYVLLHAFASRVSSSAPGGKIDTVIFKQPGLNDTTIHVKASREVIISAGSINTPRLLLHSGIGNATALKALNITVIKDLPSVGRNLSDHVAILSSWNRTANDTLEHWTTNLTASAEALAQWNSTRTGPFTDALTNQLGFFRLNESSPDVRAIFDQYGEVAPGPQAPHIQLFPVNEGPFSMGTLLLTPYSRGSVQLNPADPYGLPLLDIGFYTSPADILLMRQAILKMLRFVSAPVWKKNLGSPVGGIATVIDSDQGHGINMTVLDQFLRSTSFSIHHATGTAAMSAVGDSWGVVDPNLQVKGLKGLRIVDASVLPYIPTSNVQVPTYAVAERAADIIKRGY